ncbi:uncharacterized protein LOC119341393 isoform X4 [Triticum dicoccoides]|uniref:uncharacterized protein LOC119341393 isoform X4 n=1 Tax=Triticum dicoccoides TaxID=85692 RepID=UPI0018917AC2|nr:uncharacterized protein LOC119341393 isoform X4 [Triticum dicoccoides]
MASNNNKTSKGGSSKTVTPHKIHSASPTPNTRQHDALNARDVAGDNSKTVTPMNIHLASPTPNTRQQDALNARAATDQPRRHAPSSSASNRNGQSSTSSSQRGHAECHGAGKPKSAGTKYK